MKIHGKPAPLHWLFLITLLSGGFMDLRAQESGEKPEPRTKIKIIKIINGDTTIIEKEGGPHEMEGHMPHRPRRLHPPMMEKHRMMMCMPDSMHGKKCKEIIFVHENGDSVKVDCKKTCPENGPMHRPPHPEFRWEEKEIMIEKEKGRAKNQRKAIKAEVKMNIDIFPNPTKGIVNLDIITTEKDLDLKVLDINGQEVMQKNYKINDRLKTQLDLSGLAKGIYTIVLRTPAQLEVTKIRLD
jgi:hypothetical protein